MEESTKPVPVVTSGVGTLAPGEYKFTGTTTFSSFKDGLDQTIVCDATASSNDVSILFRDAKGNPVGMFKGTSTLPASSSYSGSGACSWK